MSIAQLEMPAQSAIVSRGLWRDAARRLRRNRAGMVGLVLIALFVFVAIAAPLIAPYGPNVGRIQDKFLPPSPEHLLGTDLQGRDLLSRILFGARSSLYVGLLSVSIGFGVGVTYGALAGFIGGWIDFWAMRFVDIVLAMPGLLLTIAIVVWLGPGLDRIAFAIAVGNMPIFARIVRSSILALKESDFVLAARSMGASSPRILLAHVLPNALTPVIVQATLTLATAIIDAAGLQFLGFGDQDPGIPEWGAMLTDTFRYIQAGATFTALFPGMAIVISVLGFNLLGDGLRESLDPRLKR
ncbi:MAG: peptide ABC transporter permease [Chloroflexi bacterium GWC2_73_18]|nr:MAG: peptide ABC transporter permease [Chloroflexi bacterium GWC2_73_18]